MDMMQTLEAASHTQSREDRARMKGLFVHVIYLSICVSISRSICKYIQYGTMKRLLTDNSALSWVLLDLDRVWLRLLGFGSTAPP